MKILIIKLGAKGDVIRTLPILKAIKKRYPESEIYWITKSNIADILEGQPLINKVHKLESYGHQGKFDILYNFDIEEEATSLAEEIESNKKYGFYSRDGYAMAFNLGAEYYLNTLFDDELKKTNKKTYQEMMFEAAELKFQGEHETIYLDEQDKKFAEKFVKGNNLSGKKLVGIHMGAGPRWPSKAWSKEKIKEFIIRVKKKGYEVILFGGPDEVKHYAKFASELEQAGIKIYQNNPLSSNKEFTSLIELCDEIVCSDSLALHVALALKKPTIGLFFCTSPNEVESYGLLKKVVSPLLADFFPEKMDQYSEELVNSISAEEVESLL